MLDAVDAVTEGGVLDVVDAVDDAGVPEGGDVDAVVEEIEVVAFAVAEIGEEGDVAVVGVLGDLDALVFLS